MTDGREGGSALRSTDGALWDFDELVAAAGGTADGAAPGAPITGLSIDTREIGAGDVFIALKSNRDGHEFVGQAFARGAAAALVATDYARGERDGALIRVADTQAALEAIGRAARARLPQDARVVAVTGSAGKTTTKEMLRAMFEAIEPGRVHASVKSFNNHWGVPLTLARMPRDTAFAVFEIGMNHANEIRPLVKMVRPHVAVITTIAPAHLGNFESIEGIADAKAEIFEGLVPGGVAVIPRDNAHYARLRTAAVTALGIAGGDDDGEWSEQIHTFGEHPQSMVRLDIVSAGPGGSELGLHVPSGDRLSVPLSIAGRHNALNAVAAIAAWFEVAGDRAPPEGDDQGYRGFGRLCRVLGGLALDPAGRGQVETIDGVTIIDESYNANPASMAAALDVLGLPRDGVSRRIAVLGDMLELGADADRLHAELAGPIGAAGVDAVFACGARMAALWDVLPQSKRGGWAETADGLTPLVLDAVRPGDAVMVKASNGSKLGPLVAALKSHLRKNCAA